MEIDIFWGLMRLDLSYLLTLQMILIVFMAYFIDKHRKTIVVLHEEISFLRDDIRRLDLIIDPPEESPPLG